MLPLSRDERQPAADTLPPTPGEEGVAASTNLPADLHALVAEVVGQVPRLLALQDRDPDSPMRGCMHPAYWRDKSSDVADMRRQEAALTFAWLWRHPLPGNRYHRDGSLLHAALRALRFWTVMQHRDGTFDEWYTGEHGYATTAFSTYAVALAVEALGERLSDPLRERVVRSLRLGADWLTGHHDWFKTNHEAVGVAALGAVGHLLDDDAYRRTASRHAARIAERMHAEGWSREITGVDVGYTFLLAEYLGMHAVLNGDRDVLASVTRAYRFAADFLHPDLTTGAEYGICGNPYFSRVATVIAARHDPVAAAVLAWMARPSPEPPDTSATLKDDLRLSRYAYQPLLAALLYLGRLPRRDVPLDAAPQVPAAPLLFERLDEDRWYPGARLAAVARPGYAAWFAVCHGGFLRIAFRNGDGFVTAVADRGYALDHGSKVFRNARYSLDADVDRRDDAMTVTAPLVECSFVMPPYWARVGLRVATAMPMGHRWSRWLIDRWRARKGTALNQSAAAVGRGRSPYRLRREVRFHADYVEIVDRIESDRGPIDPGAVFMVLDGPIRLADGTRPDFDRRVGLAGLVDGGQATLSIHKQIRLEDGYPTLRIIERADG